MTSHKEVVEVKRVFKHPMYKSPTLYHNIAVIELGRRIEYDYRKFGDTPICLDRGTYDNVGKLCKVQVVHKPIIKDQS